MTTTTRNEHRAPPFDSEAEENALGAAMLDASAAAAIAATLEPSDFFDRRRRVIFEAVRSLVAEGAGVDATTVADRLKTSGTLAEADGKAYLAHVLSSCPASSNVESYVGIVRRDGERRRLLGKFQTFAADLMVDDPDQVRGRALIELERPEDVRHTDRIVGAASFALDIPEHEEPIWGRGSEVVWSPGEVLVVVGPPGVGKTTLAQRVMLAMAGHETEVLGLRVSTHGRPVLYIAADRPKQAGRSLRRMIDESDRSSIDERVLVHRGPLGYDVAREPERLAAYAVELGVGAVIIDSLKDVAGKLSDDETGSGIVRAWNALLAADVEVCCLHHQRKGREGSKPTTLEDVYGSTWITAGAGSVVLLWGAAGDPLVELSHLKQPAENVGPLEVEIDHTRGRLEVTHEADLLGMLRRSPAGLAAMDAARLLFGHEKPTRAETMKARRKLDRLVTDRHAVRRPADLTPGAIKEPDRYFAAALEGAES